MYIQRHTPSPFLRYSNSEFVPIFYSPLPSPHNKGGMHIKSPTVGQSGSERQWNNFFLRENVAYAIKFIPFIPFAHQQVISVLKFL